MNLILGGPGTGKTTRLLEIMKTALADGVSTDRIAFVSFTRKAVGEAIDRAVDELGVDRRSFPYFRTIHSLAYRELGLTRGVVMTADNFKELGDMLGLEIAGRDSGEDGPWEIPLGDRVLFLDGFARSTMRPLRDVWHEIGEDIEWLRVKQFSDALRAYKDDFFLVDFTDMLELFLGQCSPVPVDVAIIDEAQDLNPLQWAVVDRAFAGARSIYVAGDDDQAIYKWSGADVPRFLSIDATTREVLPVSHRLPPQIFDFAVEIISRVEHRYEKKWSPRHASGDVEFYRDYSSLDLTSGTWLMLARNAHFLRRFRRVAENQGVTYVIRGRPSVDPDDGRAIVAYEKKLKKGERIGGRDAVLVLDRLGRGVDGIDPDKNYLAFDLGIDVGPIWHEAMIGISLRRREYYVSVLRRGENLLRTPRITIDTIHAAKGGEADHVAVMTDMTKRTFDGYRFAPDDEHRVFYVGFTRARESLHVVLPQTSRGYVV